MVEWLVDSHMINQFVGYQRSYNTAKGFELDPRSFKSRNNDVLISAKNIKARLLGKMFYDHQKHEEEKSFGKVYAACWSYARVAG
ncbi:hypothetical protein J3F84DRAFT_363174 [Trichoderma pleuroticola]